MDDLISRDDAIRELNGACSSWEDDAKVQEIVMAIPSAKPTGDLISRADAIDCCECHGSQECKDRIKALPSAEAVQGWIPVEEQPPVFPCLVCDANGNQPSVPLGIVTITDEEHGEWHIDGRLWDSPKAFVDGEWGSQLGYGNRIIAWMPLPNPYKGGDSE